MRDEQLGQGGKDIVRVEPARDDDRPALAVKLINDSQHSKGSPIVGPVGDEIVGPHVMRILWPYAYARTIVEPQPAAFGLLTPDLKPFPPPDAAAPAWR